MRKSNAGALRHIGILIIVCLIATMALLLTGCGESGGGSWDFEVVESAIEVDEETGNYFCAAVINNPSDYVIKNVMMSGVAYNADGKVIPTLEDGGLLMVTTTLLPGKGGMTYDLSSMYADDVSIYDYYEEIPERIEWRVASYSLANGFEPGLEIVDDEFVGTLYDYGGEGEFYVTIKNTSENDYIMTADIADIQMSIIYRDENGKIIGVDVLYPAIYEGEDFSVYAGEEKLLDCFTIHPYVDCSSYDIYLNLQSYIDRTQGRQ